jgi:hypothetical protein
MNIFHGAPSQLKKRSEKLIFNLTGINNLSNDLIVHARVIWQHAVQFNAEARARLCGIQHSSEFILFKILERLRAIIMSPGLQPNSTVPVCRKQYTGM